MEFVEKLGIDLGVVDGGEEVDGAGDVHTEITAGTGGVHQGAAVVGGSDKRGEATALLDMGGVGEAHIDLVLRDEELQQGMLRAAGLVELVDVDQGARGEGQGQRGLALQVQVLGIIGAEYGRQQDAAETGLAGTLVTREQGHEGIAVLTVDAQPTGHHRKHPRVEMAGPAGGIGGYARGQGGDAVLPVPGGKMAEIVADGVMLTYLAGVDEAVEVAVPGGKPGLEGADGHRVLVFAGQGAELIAGNITLAELGLAGEGVETEFVVGVHEMAGLPHEEHILAHLFQWFVLAAGHFAVGLGEGRGGRGVDIAVGIVTQGAEGHGRSLHFDLHAELGLIENLSAMAGGCAEDADGKCVVAHEGEHRLGEFRGEVAQPAGLFGRRQVAEFEEHHAVSAYHLGLIAAGGGEVVLAATAEDGSEAEGWQQGADGGQGLLTLRSDGAEAAEGFHQLAGLFTADERGDGAKAHPGGCHFSP